MLYISHVRCATLFGAFAILILIGCADKPQTKERTEPKDKKPDVIYIPTPPEVVEKMLEVAKITKDDVVYDLGCGDGRIVCAAARRFRCKAFGFDIDPERIKECADNKAKENEEVQKLITFEKKDIFTLDLSKANVVTLYLLARLNVQLIPQLKKMKDGSRIVSHSFDMKGVTPDPGFPMKVKDADGDDRTIYRWTTPLKVVEKK
jgi:SAM-dependent methyltransferase